MSERLCDEFFYLVQYACACMYSCSPVCVSAFCSIWLSAGNGAPPSANTTGKLVIHSPSGLCSASKLVLLCSSVCACNFSMCRDDTVQSQYQEVRPGVCYPYCGNTFAVRTNATYVRRFEVYSFAGPHTCCCMTHGGIAAHSLRCMVCGQTTRKGIALASLAPGLRIAMTPPQIYHQSATAPLTRTLSQTWYLLWRRIGRDMGTPMRTSGSTSGTSMVCHPFQLCCIRVQCLSWLAHNDASLHWLPMTVMLLLLLVFFIVRKMQHLLIPCLQEQSSICLQFGISPHFCLSALQSNVTCAECCLLTDSPTMFHTACNNPVAALVCECCVLLSILTAMS